MNVRDTRCDNIPRIYCDGKPRMMFPTLEAAQQHLDETNQKGTEARECPNPKHGFHLHNKTNPPRLGGYHGSEEYQDPPRYLTFEKR